MGARDFALWSKEATRHALQRKAELYGASLLPHQKSEHVRASVEELKMHFYELDNEDDIQDVEEMARQRLEEMRKKRRGQK